MILNILRKTNKSTKRNCRKELRRKLGAISCSLALTCMPTLVFAIQGTDYIVPPKFNTMDKFGVNVLGGQVSASLDTVSIGGDMGLTHGIRAHTNLFTTRGNYGYTDKYAGGLKWIELGDQVPFYNGGPTYNLFVLKASVLGDSADFIVMRDGAYQSGGGDYTSNYYYEALGDKRHTLELRGNSTVWTKPDGTEVYFQGGYSAGANRSVQKIVYPNGFTITVYYNTGVTTNTGFQLKYDYIADNSGLEASKINAFFPTGSNVPSVALSQNWWFKNPKYIRAINNAEEYCDPTVTDPCSLVRNWPKATFNWPGGMPRAIFINQSIFSVEDAAGGTTQFHYEAQDAALSDLNNPNSIIDGYAAKMRIAPRLIAITPAGAVASTLQYKYKNDIISKPTSNGSAPYLVSDSGIIVSATGLLGSSGYQRNTADQYGARMSYRGAHISLISNVSNIPETLETITEYDGDRVINFQQNFRNFVGSETSQNGPSKIYGYDARNNLERVTLAGKEVITAEYPATCTNRKTCNQPTFVTDARGNTTNYTYHEFSGQVATVTLPADKNGKRAQTRYEYAQKYANIKNASGTKVPADTPVWLKTEERYCTTNDNCAGAADEVVTQYEYNSDNLLLTGMTVTADNKTLRTCYRYDIYGRQIGQTQPKADLATCN